MHMIIIGMVYIIVHTLDQTQNTSHKKCNYCDSITSVKMFAFLYVELFFGVVAVNISSDA